MNFFEWRLIEAFTIMEQLFSFFLFLFWYCVG